MICPYCHSPYVERSRRRPLERLLSVVGVYPWRCEDCLGRFYSTSQGAVGPDDPDRRPPGAGSGRPPPSPSSPSVP